MPHAATNQAEYLRHSISKAASVMNIEISLLRLTHIAVPGAYRIATCANDLR